MNRFFSWCCKIFLAPLVKWLFIKEVKGKENIPSPLHQKSWRGGKGNFILVSNHQSYLDIIFDAYLCVPRKFHFIGQIEGFKPPLKWFIAAVYFLSGVIPLNRKDDYSREKVVDLAIKVLKKGDVLIIYPEGRRSVNGEIQEGKWGVARIFLKTGVPILPAGIKGAFELLPPHGKLKIKKIVKINIGQPLFFKEELSEAGSLDEDSLKYREAVQKITKKIMIEISNLC
jgi:1-acyl-sn-glycerol-3-phosphate acyltransferase